MSYTKQVRVYCGKHSKGLIDISVVRNTVFADVPYKTMKLEKLLRQLLRMVA